MRWDVECHDTLNVMTLCHDACECTRLILALVDRHRLVLVFAVSICARFDEHFYQNLNRIIIILQPLWHCDTCRIGYSQLLLQMP